MEATRVHDPAAPQAAITKSFAPGAAGKQQQQQQQQQQEGRNGALPSEDGEFDGDILLENSEDPNNWVEEQGDGRFPIRAPVSDDAEEIGDGEGSFGSGESFDSALERMAASSTASNEAFASPKDSPVGSYSAPGASPGLGPSLGPSLGLESSQQGALMRLNELNSGVSSLDPALITSSGTGDEFRARVVQIARKNDLSADDAAVKNILDLLIPLIDDASPISANGNGVIDGAEDCVVDGAEEFQRADEALVTRPVAKVTAEDDPLSNSDEDGEESGEPGSEEAEFAESEDPHSEDESDVHGAQSAQGLWVAGGNEIELGEEKIAISGSEPALDKVVADEGKADRQIEFDEGKVDAKTESDEGKDDVKTESEAPLHEVNSISDSPESEQSSPESHGSEDAKTKIEEQIVDPEERSDTKSEKDKNLPSVLGEENLPRAEESTEPEVNSEETMKDESDKDKGAVSESLNLELQNLQEKNLDPQKAKEEDLQEVSRNDSVPEKQKNQHSGFELPKEDPSESEKSKKESTEHQVPEAVPDPAVENRKEETETGNLETSGSHLLPKTQGLEARDGSLEAGDGSDKIVGGLEVANEHIISEPEAAQLNKVAQVISSESDDQKQGNLVDSHVDHIKEGILADLDVDHKKEAVDSHLTEGEEMVEVPRSSDSSPSHKNEGNLVDSHVDSKKEGILADSHVDCKKEVVDSHVTEGEETAEVARSLDFSPSLFSVDAETVYRKPEDARASAGITLESVKGEGDRTEEGVDGEGALPKDACQLSVVQESKPSDTSAPEDSGTEYINDQDRAVGKQTEAVEAGEEFEAGEYAEPHVKEGERTDTPDVEEQQPKVEGSDSLTSQISAESEAIEKDMKLEDNPEDLPTNSDFIEKSDEDLPTVAQSQGRLENGNVSGLSDGTSTALEQSQPPADTPSKNQASKDALNGSSISVSFKDDDDEEDEDNYWNEKEINVDDEEDDDDDALQRSAALAALVRAVNSSGGGAGTPSLGSAGPSLPARPAGLGRSMPSLEPAPRAVQQPSTNGVATSRPSAAADNSQPNGEANDGNSETREKLQAIRVKFLRLAHRLGQSAQNVVVAQVLYRLGLAEQLRGGQSASRSSAFGFDRASAIAEEEEAAGQEELDFACTIMLLGKTGVGKSATINSIFDEVKAPTNAFTFATRKVQEITGTVHGIKLRVIDTPGLLPSVADQRQNEKIMASVKHFIKKSPPDIVLYFDRLDMPSRDFGDIPLLRTITDTFGAAIWFNAIVVLTHASSAPPDGPNGVPVSYETFVAQRSHVVQQTIRQAAGDTRLMNPVSLVENHPACRTNRAGERVLPNGQIWKPQLLLLSFASKILAEANSLLKLQESTPGKPFGTRSRVPPLPFLLSSLLQSRAQLKMPEEQMGDEDESDDDVDDEESDDEVEYDELPPFRRLSKEEIEELDKEQRRLYFEELEDREKLFQKKQWKEELRRRKELKKRMAAAQKADLPPSEEVYDEDGGKSAAVPVALPDMALPPSFDSDNPSHRYRYLESASQWLVRPVLETHGWDHDSGYDGLNLEKVFIVGNKVPVSLSGQVTKDKKEANVTLESAASLRHGEGKVTLAGIDVQTMGKDLSYTLRSETRFSNFKHNKTIAGLAVTMLGDTIAAGLKLEDRLLLGKRLKLVMNGGAITGRGDVAYGGTMEITLKDKDYPISRTLSTLGFSVMDWHGDLAIGGNLQSQFVIGKTMMVARANLNNRGAGQISIRASSSEQFQMALIGIIPIVRALFGNRLFSSSHST